MRREGATREGRLALMAEWKRGGEIVGLLMLIWDNGQFRSLCNSVHAPVYA